MGVTLDFRILAGWRQATGSNVRFVVVSFRKRLDESERLSLRE
jgi:hypothetical protein